MVVNFCGFVSLGMHINDFPRITLPCVSLGFLLTADFEVV